MAEYRKISQLQDFEGKELLLEIQRLGLEVAAPAGITDTALVMILGIGVYLAKQRKENG